MNRLASSSFAAGELNDDTVILGPKDDYYFPPEYDCVRINVDWVSKTQAAITDFDLNVLCYDERVRFFVDVVLNDRTASELHFTASKVVTYCE